MKIKGSNFLSIVGMLALLFLTVKANGQGIVGPYTLAADTSGVIKFVPTSGQIVTNGYRVAIHISGEVTNVQAAVAGTTRYELQVYVGGLTNITKACGNGTTASSLAVTNMFDLEAWVPAGGAWAFTNKVVGTGNAANPAVAQIYIPPR